MYGVGASGGKSSRRPRLGLLVAVAALFVLIPASQASAEDFTLKVHVAGEGSVECYADGLFEGECEEEQEYPEGTEIFLEPFAETGYEFKEFSGCDVVGPEECELTMDEDRAVTATFNPIEYELAIERKGSGTGTVECEIELVPAACAKAYPEGTLITLVAEAGSGSAFAGFSGDCEGAPGECELDMAADRVAVVTFNLVESGGGGGSTPTPSSPAVIAEPAPGKVSVGGAGLYKGGKATLRLTCKGRGPCRGTIKLVAKLKVGGKAKKLTVGKGSFSLPAGESKALTVKLSGPAQKLLGKGRTLTAKVGGSGVTASTVKIKPSAR